MKQGTFKVGTTSDLYMNNHDLFGDTLPETEAIRRLAKTGFDAMDFGIFWHEDPHGHFWGDDYLDYAKTLADAANEAGIFFSQAHAPIFNLQDPKKAKMYDLTLRSFEIAQVIGAPYLVVHPQFLPGTIYDRNHDAQLKYNLEFYGKMLDLSAKTGVKIALENMFGFDPEKNALCPTYFSTAEDILELMDYTDGKEQFVVCLDTGHAHIANPYSISDYIRKFDKQLKLLHIHDNFGTGDDHMPPFHGDIDWKDTIHALREVDYDGVLSLESQTLCFRMPNKDQKLLQTAVDLTYQSVRHLSEL